MNHDKIKLINVNLLINCFLPFLSQNKTTTSGSSSSSSPSSSSLASLSWTCSSVSSLRTSTSVVSNRRRRSRRVDMQSECANWRRRDRVCLGPEMGMVCIHIAAAAAILRSQQCFFYMSRCFLSIVLSRDCYRFISRGSGIWTWGGFFVFIWQQFAHCKVLRSFP